MEVVSDVRVQDWLKYGVQIHYRGGDGQPRYQVQVDEKERIKQASVELLFGLFGTFTATI